MRAATATHRSNGPAKTRRAEGPGAVRLAAPSLTHPIQLSFPFLSSPFLPMAEISAKAQSRETARQDRAQGMM